MELNETEKKVPQLSFCLLVLKTENIESLKNFYEKLGFFFLKYQHQTGQVHYCSENLGFTFEVYPSTACFQNPIRMGFRVSEIHTQRQQLIENGIECSEIRNIGFGDFFVTQDPDNNKIEMYDGE